ncbi:hypothetical protein [Psychroflexus aestuariivivens]|uniref:hypothetical protein n=1 Tax=Psychroflexus aestuariivivens TaxID=1795040 RepID=UPI000FDB4A64|nr:hypothetical protein [Psychroflexus aestuariivivens]
MDIIELKSAWNLLQQDINKDKVEENEIMTSLYGKSKSEISKIKSNLHFKFVMASVSIIVAISLAIATNLKPAINPLDFVFTTLESTIFFIIMALTIALVLFFNYKAYIHIQYIQHSNLNLKDNLKNFIKAMKKAIRFNMYSDALITPIIFEWLYYAYAFKNDSLGFDLKTALLFILPITIGVMSYLVQRFIQNLKFGNYLKRLDDYLKSLQNNS